MLPRWALGLCFALALTAPAAPVPAADGDASATLCEHAILNGARRGGVPPEVLHAIALTETGRKEGGRIRPFPWAVNREGKGHWFSTREEALRFAQASLTAGRPSFDVGCVQINYRWHGHAFPSLEAMFDPEWTATYAAQFLRTLYEERGSWSEAAGAYHSLTPELARIYRERFDRLLAGLDTDALRVAAAAAPAPVATGDRQSRRLARREAIRRAVEARRAQAGPPAPAVKGSIASMLFEPASGALLVEGGPLLTPGAALLAAPPGRLW